jgi:hypothetical protein
MSFYGGTEFDRLYRSHITPPTHFHGPYHSSPYGYHHDHTRYDLRQDYNGQHVYGTVIGEREPQESNEQQPRRRIAVAVGRYYTNPSS